MASIIDTIISFFYKKPIQGAYSCGPNNFAELLEQFDLPPKIKTEKEIINTFKTQIKMYNLEWEMLKMDPTMFFLGSRKTINEDIVDIDFVPCSVRPDVIYCNIGKN